MRLATLKRGPYYLSLGVINALTRTTKYVLWCATAPKQGCKVTCLPADRVNVN